MRSEREREGLTLMQHSAGMGRVMWITPDRVFYFGLLGAASMRSFGAICIYVAVDSEVRISVDDGVWRSSRVAVIQPHTDHRVACDSRHIAVIHVEPETVDLEALPALLRGMGSIDECDDFRVRVLRCHDAITRNDQCRGAPVVGFDEFLFGTVLAPRRVDPRIAHVLDSIRRDPASKVPAQDCAVQVHLSLSRFLHLFKSEVGTSFRSFRAWKRARSLLHYVVDQGVTLTDVALGAGYPDSTHFSHSIRQVYGLRPKDIFAGSRDLRVIG